MRPVMSEPKVVAVATEADDTARGRLSVPALALEYVEEIAKAKGMTKGEVVLIAVTKLREELLAA